MLLTVHNLFPHDSRFRLIHSVANRTLGLLMDRLLVHSPEAAETVAKHYGGHRKIRCIEHVDYGSCTSPPLDKSQARARLQLSPQETIVAWFGELRPYKRVELLIQAADRLSELGIHLLIAGRPQSEEYGKTIASLASDRRNIRLQLQWLSEEDLAQTLSAADAAIFAYAESLTSGAAHMALVYGLPIVAPQTVAFAELARLGLAFTFSSAADPSAIAAAASRAVEVDRTLFEAASRAYRARCSLESVGAQLRDIYEELLPGQFTYPTPAENKEGPSKFKNLEK
jgi:glycosyltransferase involved in cell wall biosynthesis